MRLFIGLILATVAWGQGSQPASAVRPVSVLPATCNPAAGSVVALTVGLKGLYSCTNTNTWTYIGSGGGGGGGTWGLITGTLSNQTDLNTALGLRALTSTTITATTPLTGGGSLAANRTIGCQTASTSLSGCLSSTDWNTFNGKQAALTNPVTGTGTSGTLGKFTGTSTIGNAAASDVVSLFSTCSGTQYLGADGACHNAGGGSGTVTSIATTSPITGGTITSTGTIACATCVTSAASLTSTAIVTGAGSQGTQTPSSTATLDSSGNISTPGSISTGAGGSTAGTLELTQGNAPVAGTTSVKVYAPLSVTSYIRKLGAAAATGLYRGDNSAGVVTDSQAELSGDVTTSGSNVASVVKVNGGTVPTSATFTATNGSAQFTGYTATTATAALNVMVGDSGSGGTKGLAPAPGAGDAAAGKFLKADGTYAIPPGSGGTGCIPGGSAGQLLVDSGSAGCNSNADFVITSHTLAGGASAILDLSAASPTAGLKIPTTAGAAPTADGQLAFNSTTHTLKVGLNGTSATVTTSVTRSIGWRFATTDGSALSGTQTGCRYVPFGGTITGWHVDSDVSGSATFGVKTVAFASYTGTSGFSGYTDMTGGGTAPSVSSGTQAAFANLTSWTTSFSAGLEWCLQLTSPSTTTGVNVTIDVTTP